MNAIRKTGARTWLDFENIRPGERWKDAVDAAVASADVVLVLDAGEGRSTYAADEVASAQRLGKKVVYVQVKHREGPDELGIDAVINLGSAEGADAVASLVMQDALRARAGAPGG